REREQAGEEQIGIAGRRVAQAAEHLAEHEEEEERLQDDLGEEDRELAPGDGHIAAEHGQEHLTLGRDRLAGGDGVHGSVLPVRWMKTSSSVGVPSLTSASDEPCSARTAAAGATSRGASPVT